MTWTPIKLLKIKQLKLNVRLLTILSVISFWMPTFDFFTVNQDYLPLHTLLELFSMAVAAAVFTLAWSLRRECDGRLLWLGVGFLLVAWIDTLHILSYEGMPVFVTPNGPEKAINFWLASRLSAAVALLLYTFLPMRPVPSWTPVVSLLTALLLASLTTWLGLWHADVLPHTFVSGRGLTTAKVLAEYVLVLMFAISTFRLARQARVSGTYSLALMAAAA